MVVSRYTHPASVISTLLEETTLLFGWTDSNDRRENVWMLISSICIPIRCFSWLLQTATGTTLLWKHGV